MAGRNYENYWGRQQEQKPFTQVNFRSILRNNIVAILQFSGSAYRSAHVMQTLIVSSRFLAILSHAKNLSPENSDFAATNRHEAVVILLRVLARMS